MSVYLLFILWPQIFGADDFNEVQHNGGLIANTLKKPNQCKSVAEHGDRLTIHYVLKLNDANGKQIDSSRDRGVPFQFNIGVKEVRILKVITKITKLER